MNALGRAIHLVAREFESRTDKGGKPYVLHCLWVMNKVRHLGEDYMIAAVLHDLVEDSDWTIEHLRKQGFSDHVVYAVDMLTHRKEHSYDQYIERVLMSEIAVQVKLRDLEHNSKITRLKGIGEKDLERIGKYHRVYKKLEPRRR